MAAFLMAFTLVCTSSPADLYTGAATETVYAAQVVAISSEEDLVAMQENPDGNYYLAKDIVDDHIRAVDTRFFSHTGSKTGQDG